MKKLNNKGFTLVEVIAVVVIIAILGMVAVPNILGTINKSNDSTYNILVSDIVVASQQLFEEVEYNGSKIKKYDHEGIKFPDEFVEINNACVPDDELNAKCKYIEVNLQTLVSNGLLTGSNNPDVEAEGVNKNKKIIVNPKDKKDIGECSIKITKVVGDDYATSYTIEANPGGESCPSTEDYQKALK